MRYHAKLDYGAKTHFFYNYSEESIGERIVLPFVNGQVVFIDFNKSKLLFNMGSATSLKVYRTKERLTIQEEKSVVEQMKEQSFEEKECTTEIVGKIQGSGTSKALSSLIQKALQPSKPQIFIVMKFGDENLDSAYEGAYKVVAKEFGLECLRIDEVQDSGKISDQILNNIAESKYVLCDLTGARPNCYYETGFAHALGKEIILLANKKEKIHFDLQGHRFIQWATEQDLRTKLHDRLSTLESKKSREE
jgi:nucleoside 2-deoxyribosyltransferase